MEEVKLQKYKSQARGNPALLEQHSQNKTLQVDINLTRWFGGANAHFLGIPLEVFFIPLEQLYISYLTLLGAIISLWPKKHQQTCIFRLGMV